MKSIIIIALLITYAYGDTFYETLGVSKQATEREIRKAFKKKALELHPDKNPDDENAQDNFIKLNRAYEVLKDEETRKKYDLYGEEGLDNSRSHGNKYHSWNYYRDNFGIYDDDVEIITLNKADFEQSVSGSDDIWFINYYSPMCSHCHILAPIWRKVAQELDGVVRIGAVNCEDAYQLCSSQGIRSYPSLIAYPGQIRFGGEKSKENLVNFILSRLSPKKIHFLSSQNWKSEANQCDFDSWLLIQKPTFEEDDHFQLLKLKIGAVFEGLLCLGEVNCDTDIKLCQSLSMDTDAKFYSNKEDLFSGRGVNLDNLDPQEMSKEVLSHLPDIQTLSSKEYKNIMKKLNDLEETPHRLFIFTNKNDESNLEVRKLPALLPSFDLFQIDCEEMKSECAELFVVKTPAFILFKAGGGYEMHMGRSLAKDIAVFAREAAIANQFQILTPKEFPSVLSGGGAWFVDFYAPWCPPCMKLLPEFRKASRIIDFPVKFGSIDCTTHPSLCSRFNINQYPTTILYNQSVPYRYHGQHSADRLVDFVKDTINPTVIILDDDTYREKILNKKPEELWIVDFYANWCSHCLQMAPEFRRFSRMMSGNSNIRVAQIDCAVHREACKTEGVSGYPTVKLFPMNSSGNSNSQKFTGWSRDADSFRQWAFQSLPSSVTLLDESTFENMLINSNSFLVDFYAPWCGHCHVFAPDFEDVCNTFDGRIKCAKVNCQSHQWLCQAAGVRSYPSVLYYGGSVKGQRSQGYPLNTLDKHRIVQLVNKYLESKNNKHVHDEF